MAVLDFEPAGGITRAEAGVLSELVRVEFVKIRRMVVVERSDIRSVLREQARLARACEGPDCAVRIGRLLGARKIMLGSVARLRGRYILNARVVDVEEGRLEFAETVIGTSERQLISRTRSLGRKIIASMVAGEPERGESTRVRSADRRTGNLLTILFPGAGHQYSGFAEPGRMYMGGTVLALGFAAAAVAEVDRLDRHDRNSRRINYISFEFARDRSPPDSRLREPGARPLMYYVGDIEHGKSLANQRELQARALAGPLLWMGIALLDFNIRFQTSERIELIGAVRSEGTPGAQSAALALVWRF